MANSRDFTGKNRKFTGTKGIIPPKGTTGQRVGVESGELRFNTTTELMEYYDGNQWKPIDAPPTISSISTSDAQGTNTVLNADGSSLFTITITGGNFSIGPTVRFIGSTGTEYTPGNINRVSASSITCTTLSNMGTTDDPYDVRVTNTSGLSATFDDAFSYNAAPVFATASGQIGSVYNGQVSSFSSTAASDAEGNTITYSIISGALPGTGLTLSSSTGLITGTLASAPSLGNYPFVVRASTTEGVVERQFSIQVIAVPPVTANFLVVAGGGGNSVNQGGNREAGSGGGGLRTSYGSTSGRGSLAESTLSLTKGQVYTVTVGNGASGRDNGGTSSISGSGISTISCTGGGGGGHNDGSSGMPGGCGGGGWYVNGGGSGTANQGYDGSPGFGAPEYGGCGGGAGGAGGRGTSTGAGLSVSITGSPVTYSQGGAANDFPGTNRNANGSTNTGNGASGAANGGSGIVILRVPTADYSGTTTGSPTVTTDGSDKVIVFNASGSYTA